MQITYTRDEEADVWIAASEEPAGLVLEDGDLNRLKQRVLEAAPELMELNEQ